ncbi:MAG: U32 family peptidase [Clostridia bacterium]|nr:U32 family peptidase [Clostridia bacterium]
MITDITKLELLAPAGSPEALEAAVASGADAVYLGLDEFSARSKAINFNKDNLKDYIAFCHNKGVKVFVTLNTLIYDNEMSRAIELACFARNCGADALIIQDIGLFSLIKQQIPEIHLHASTQMSINSPDGAAHMKRIGFDRVILAREMNLLDIKKAKDTGIETEVFIHGARCYSYSGQCLMSSMLGGRSGNRGMCAQTCRLPYTLSDENGNVLLSGHLLSLKDTMYLTELSDLNEAGVSALKIEGRMKGPEYVSAVTSIYRKYLDDIEHDIEKKDLDDLLKAFNREGFSKGALSDNQGRNEFASTTTSDSGFPVGKVIKSVVSGSYAQFDEAVSKDDGLRIGAAGGYAERDIEPGARAVVPIQGNPGDVVFRTRDNQFNDKYSYTNTMRNLQKVSVKARAVIKSGLKPYMEIWDQKGNRGTGTLDSPVEKARLNGTLPSRIKEQLTKTGATDFEIIEFDFQCDDGIYIKISDINELRRLCTEELFMKRTAVPTAVSCNVPELSHGNQMVNQPDYSLLLYNVPMDFDPSGTDIRRIYLDFESCHSEIEKVRELCKKNGIEFFLHLPYSLRTVPNEECDGYLIENPGMLENLPLEKTVIGSGFNVCNSFSLKHYKGALNVTLSHEVSLDDIIALKNPLNIPLEATVYGNIRVMESPYCPARDICDGSLCIDKKLKLTDRKNEQWGVIFNSRHHSVRIFNPHKLMVFDKLIYLMQAGISMFRLNITDETNDEIHKLIKAAREERVPRQNPSNKYTNGRY